MAADSSEAAHQIVLVPGFFGFGRLGDLTYFNGVAAALERRFAARGVPVAVTEVTTLPTASIRVRAARVLETLARVAALGTGPIHVIGHSTGGLDARLAIAPTASLPTDVEGFDYARVKTLVSVCCPHFGTPLATWFSGTFGKPVLRLLSLYWIWVLRRGRLPLSIALRLWYWVVRLRDPFRKHRSTFDEVYEKLLNNLTDERRAELIAFLEAVSTDQSLLFQLTPAGCDLLNACTADPELRYGSVVARSPGATFRRFLRSIRDLYPQIVYPIYSLLHALIARGENQFVPPPAPPQRERLLSAYGALPEPGDNDGMVPTNSQVWGEVIHAVSGDHLDLVGQFGFEDDSGFSGDWLPSYAGFDRAQFEELWTRVADFLIDSVNQPPTDNVGTERTEQDVPAPPH